MEKFITRQQQVEAKQFLTTIYDSYPGVMKIETKGAPIFEYSAFGKKGLLIQDKDWIVFNTETLEVEIYPDVEFKKMYQPNNDEQIRMAEKIDIIYNKLKDQDRFRALVEHLVTFSDCNPYMMNQLETDDIIDKYQLDKNSLDPLIIGNILTLTSEYRLCKNLVQQLSEFAGDSGESEGAADCLKRLLHKLVSNERGWVPIIFPEASDLITLMLNDLRSEQPKEGITIDFIGSVLQIFVMQYSTLIKQANYFPPEILAMKQSEYKNPQHED